jgi:hypothetical protein
MGSGILFCVVRELHARAGGGRFSRSTPGDQQFQNVLGDHVETLTILVGITTRREGFIPSGGFAPMRVRSNPVEPDVSGDRQQPGTHVRAGFEAANSLKRLKQHPPGAAKSARKTRHFRSRDPTVHLAAMWPLHFNRRITRPEKFNRILASYYFDRREDFRKYVLE